MKRADCLGVLGATLVSAVAMLGSGCGSDQPSLTSYPSQSNIQNVILIVQENKSFDSYFGRYCTAPPGSNPTCTTGPACCEAAPAMDPNGTLPTVLDDTLSAKFDPNHNQACMLSHINGGLMDGYTAGAGCGVDVRNFALATTVVDPYWQLAGRAALADRYFQPAAGASAENDMFFAGARFLFADNDFGPDFVGHTCSFIGTTMHYSTPTITSLLEGAGLPWRVYAEGIDTMRGALAAGQTCPQQAPADCPLGLAFYPCVFDSSDIPFAYYANANDDPEHFLELSHLETDLRGGTLPAFSFVKFLGYRSEHAGLQSRVSDGVAAVTDLLDTIEHSRYASRTLVILTWDESGGYFDHVAPPPTNPVDNQAYGARAPMLVIGHFARPNAVSHVTMEHSSIVRFLEWNFLGGVTGQLGARDANVNNIGSLIDPVAAGTPVPEQ